MNIMYLSIIILQLNISQSIQSGKCPSECRHDQVCKDSECPYGGCKKGWWGRQCEYPLECLIPGDNGAHYRGTWNTTVSGKPCQEWSLVSHAGSALFTPTDGTNHNYCRHIISDPKPNAWCYTGGSGGTDFASCPISMCDNQCLPPNLTSDYVVVKPPREGLAIGTKLQIACKTGYNTKVQFISCGGNKQWTSPHNCQALECMLPGDNGIHYRGTQNTTRDGTPCIPWNIAHPQEEQFKIPIDGTNHNYCRHVPGFSMSHTWCYTTSLYQGAKRKPCSIPICSKYCSPPDLQQTPLAVEIPKTGLLTGTYLDLNCKAGYIKNRSVKITCGLDGQWSAFPSRICNECPADRFGISCLGICQCNKSYTEKCDRGNGTCHCIPGRRGIDCSYDVNECETHVRICGDNSHCTNTEGSYACVCHSGYTRISGYCQAINCTKLEQVHAYSSLRDHKALYKYTDVVNVVCDLGYETENGTNMTYLSCDTNGQWNGSVPFCKAICDHPTIHPNSRVRHNFTTYTLNDTIGIECDEGYKLIGQSWFICQDNRSWNGTMPKCIANCSIPETNPHSRVRKLRTEYIINDTAEVICEDGYELRGQSKIICQESGRWNGTMPSCADSRDQSTPKAYLAGIILLMFFVVGTLIIISVYVLHKRKQLRFVSNRRIEFSALRAVEDAPTAYRGNEINEDNRYEMGNTTMCTRDGAYGYNGDIKPTEKAIKIETFKNPIKTLLADENPLFDEFDTLTSGLQYPALSAQTGRNAEKNKYKNIYPYDANRVKLLQISGQKDSDYINASFVQGFGTQLKYIAAQGPLPNSVDDFWRMVWELNVQQIVMLTNVFENGRHKCMKYWPSVDYKLCGSIVVTLLQENVFADFTIRDMTLTQAGECRALTQYHYTIWPDNGVPKCPSSLINFRNQVLQRQANLPIVVHCSAGIGRTGTYISLDYLLDQAITTGYVDVFECVETLRQQRVNMVQTKEQYSFLHKALLEGLLNLRSAFTRENFAVKYQALFHNGKNSIENMYANLQDFTPRHSVSEFKTGKLPENKKKNRFTNIIAVDSERPSLSTEKENDTDYINAVIIPSVRKKRAFIMTQMPLPDTVCDFWKLVYEHEVTTIVMLNDSVEESCGVYWPTKGRRKVCFGLFSVKHIDKRKYYFGYISKLEITYRQEKFVVMQYRCTFWIDGFTVPSSASPLLDLIDSVQKSAEQGTILIHCLTGSEKSGLYCVLALAIQLMETGQGVDFQQIIRRIRHARPQVIPNMEQFQFCYDAMNKYLTKGGVYENLRL